MDYTNTFRSLSKNEDNLFKDKEGETWHQKYLHRLRKEKTSPLKRQEIMEKANPKFILRNYLAQEAIQDAEASDFTKLNNLLEVLKKPFEENSVFEYFAKESPDWGKKLEISCSS